MGQVPELPSESVKSDMIVLGSRTEKKVGNYSRSDTIKQNLNPDRPPYTFFRHRPRHAAIGTGQKRTLDTGLATLRAARVKESIWTPASPRCERLGSKALRTDTDSNSLEHMQTTYGKSPEGRDVLAIENSNFQHPHAQHSKSLLNLNWRWRD